MARSLRHFSFVPNHLARRLTSADLLPPRLTLPHPQPILHLPGAAEGFEGGEDVGEGGFPFGFAGEMGGNGRHVERGGGVGEQVGDGGHLFGQR